MKKKISLMLAVTMIVAFSAQSVGAVNVIMNSSFVSFPDQEPVIENGTTLVPIRPIAEKLGLEILWDDPSDTVTLKKGDFFIELVIGSSRAKTSSGEKELSQAPKIINSRTMVPLRFIAEELGLTVVWNNDLQRVIIVGEVDTTVKQPPAKVDDVATEDKDDRTGKETINPSVSDNGQVAENPTEEEETPTDENTIFAQITSSDSIVSFEVPADFLPEDTDDEESYAFRTLDAVDVQHLYNWEKVSECASFATADANMGIVYVVRALDPYEGGEYDLSKLNQTVELPTAPERPSFPDIDVRQLAADLEKAMVLQMFVDMDVEVPENIDELDSDDIMAILGFDSKADFNEQMQQSMENTDFSAVAGYDEYIAYQEEYKIYAEEKAIYDEEVKALLTEYNAVRDYASRNFATVYSKLSDEEWLTYFNSILNADPEVRYEGLEIIKINDKPVIHATIYAEDPDDEQGVYEYYEYRDKDSIVTIFGGTLFGSEAGEECIGALSSLSIM